MADNKGLIKWMMANKAALSIEARKYHWSDEFIPGLYEYGANIAIDDEKYYGMGEDRDQNNALCKAIGESVERYLIHYNKFTNSNGFAVHLCAEDAKEGAKRELLERDAFFCHFLTKTPFILPEHRGVLDEMISPTLLEKTLSSNELRFQLRQMQCADKDYAAYISVILADTVLAQGKLLFPGIKIGLGCHRDAKKAAQQSFLEVFRTMPGLIRGDDKIIPLSPEEFSELERPGVLDHTNIGYDASSLTVMDNLLSGGDNAQHKTSDFSPEISYETFSCPDILRSCPIVGARATSPALQGAYFGHLKPEYLNLKRLGEFAGREISFDDVEKHPHFLG